MTNRFCILVCENYKKELKKVTESGSELFQGVSICTFPARCGRPPIDPNEIDTLVGDIGKFDRVLVIGSCCIANLAASSSPDTDQICYQKVNQCNHIIADPYLVDSNMQSGAYVLTPGWLVNWKKHIDEWGFDKIGAREFVTKSIKKLVLLDTDVIANSSKLLQELSQYLNLPVQEIPVGIGYFSLFLENIILKWSIKKQQEQSIISESGFQKQLAEYSMIIDMVAKSSKSVNENEVIDHITDMISMLFAPQILNYLPIHNNTPGTLRQCSSESDQTIQNRLMAFSETYAETDSGKGFIINLKHADEPLGVIEIDEILFEEYKDNYLNLILSFVDVWALAITNARRYALIINQKDELTQNIDQLKTTQEHLEKAKEAAEAANIAKSVFLANMSHEIRTPMNAIIGFSEILNRKIKDTVQRNYVNSIQTSGKVLLRLINDILDLSKIEAGKMELVYDFVDIQNLMHEFNLLFKSKATEKGLTFETIVTADFPDSIEIDELRLRQVAINLIGNALKFTKQGFVKVSLAATQKTNQTITFVMKVTDSGIGIANNKIEHIFNDFAQEDDTTTRNFGGTGLGLSISRNIVTLFKGTISAESTVGEGTTFTIEIPDIKYSTLKNVHAKEVELDPDSIIFAPATILVIDDIKSNRDMLKGHLESFNFVLHFAKNGEEGVEMAEKIQPDLIFMDLRMPIMDGYQATKEIVANKLTKKIPIIACTASAFKATEEEIMESGFRGYLRKPVLLNEIIPQLCRNLKWKKIEHEKPNEQKQEQDVETEVLRVIKPKIQVLWEELQEKRTQKRQLKFADLMTTLGEEQSSEWLTKKGKALKDATQTFNIELVQQLMNEFKSYFNE